MSGYLDARRIADAEGAKTFGELAQHYGYNVIALASRIYLGWTPEEITSSQRDGLEFSKKATFDFTGKQHSTAGLFCAKYGIDVKALTELTEGMKTQEEFAYIINILSSHQSVEETRKLINEYKISISSSDKVSVDISKDSVTDDVASVQDIEVLQLNKAKEIRRLLITDFSNISIVDNRGNCYKTVSDFLKSINVDEVDSKEFLERVVAGFSVNEAISDLACGTYVASPEDTGEFDFKNGIDGVPFVEYCNKQGVSPQYVLTQYRRQSSTSDVDDIVNEYKKQGTVESCIRWYAKMIGDEND